MGQRHGGPLRDLRLRTMPIEVSVHSHRTAESSSQEKIKPGRLVGCVWSGRWALRTRTGMQRDEREALRLERLRQLDRHCACRDDVWVGGSGAITAMLMHAAATQD